jgi:DNA-binding NarL/FixJ family response regulator
VNGKAPLTVARSSVAPGTIALLPARYRSKGTGSMPRVLIIDDHAFIRRGVQSILQSFPEWELCGEASNATDAIQLVEQLKPDVVLMDVTMPGINGIDATRIIRKWHPQVKIILLTLHESSEILRGGFRAGANGYLLKADAEEELMKALRIVVGNGSYISPKIDQAVVAQVINELRSAD